ncbi:unnamed protein product [Ascophyllum nodosum]
MGLLHSTLSLPGLLFPVSPSVSDFITGSTELAKSVHQKPGY